MSYAQEYPITTVLIIAGVSVALWYALPALTVAVSNNKSIFYIATVLRNLGSDNGGIRVHAGNLAEADRNHLELTTSVINDVIRNQESIAALHELMTQNEGNREEEEDNQLSPTDYQLDLNNNETHEEQTERIMRAYMTVANNFRNGDFAAEREEAIDNIEANHTIISFSPHRLTQAITRLFSGINRWHVAGFIVATTAVILSLYGIRYVNQNQQTAPMLEPILEWAPILAPNIMRL